MGNGSTSGKKEKSGVKGMGESNLNTRPILPHTCRGPLPSLSASAPSSPIQAPFLAEIWLSPWRCLLCPVPNHVQPSAQGPLVGKAPFPSPPALRDLSLPPHPGSRCTHHGWGARRGLGSCRSRGAKWQSRSWGGFELHPAATALPSPDSAPRAALGNRHP